MNRRTFLKQMAAAPAVFGLADLFAQETPRSPKWYDEALERMKKTGRYGLLLIAPEKAAERIAMGERLLARIDGENPDAIEIFSFAVVVVLRSPSEQNHRILLSPAGKRIVAEKYDPEILNDPVKFVDSFVPFVFGAREERLKECAGSAAPTAEEREAISQLDSDNLEEREAAIATLAKSADRLVPWLISARKAAGNTESAGRLRMVIRQWYKSLEVAKTGPRLPYGSYRYEFIPGCGGLEDEEEGVAVDCGMARTPRASRHLLRFLTQ